MSWMERDIFPVSWYGRNTQERLRTLGASLRSCVSAFLNLTTLMILVVTTLLVASLYWGTVTWLRDYVESNPPARTVEVAKEDEKAWGMLQLLTAKPVLYVCNVAEADAGVGNSWSSKVAEKAAAEGAGCCD